MVRRKVRQVSYQIRVSQYVKDKLDALRDHNYVRFSYNNIINEILSNQEQIEKYKLCSKLISKIQEGDRPFIWEFDKLQEYVKQHEDKRKI